MDLGEILGNFFPEEQIVKRTERAVFFNLINRHFLAVNRKFDETAPAIELVGTDLADILGVAVWTLHIIHSTYPLTILMAFWSRSSLIAGTSTESSPMDISSEQGSHLRPSIKSVTSPSLISSATIVFPNFWSK